MAEGHQHAYRYPVWRVWMENDIVVTRKNRELASHMSLLQMAVSSAQGSKKAFANFKKQIEALNR